MKFTQILTLLGVVSSAAVKPPLQIRLNTNLIKNIVNQRDQNTLMFFQQRSLQPASIFEVNEHTNAVSEKPQDYNGSKFKDVVASIDQNSGNIEDFDFNLNMSAEDLGSESKNLKYSGKGKYDGKEF